MTPRDDKQVVWILGAGFSRPLGLPLARDLFTERYERIAEGFASPIMVSPENVQSRLLDSYSQLTSKYEETRGRQGRYPPERVVGRRLQLAEAELDRLSSDIAVVLAEARGAVGWFAGVPDTDGYSKDLAECQEDLKRFCDALARLYEPATEENIIAADRARQAVESWLRTTNPDSKGRLYEWGTAAVKTRDAHQNAIADALKAVRSVEKQKSWTAEELLVSLDKAARTDLSHLRLWSTWGGPKNTVPAIFRPLTILKHLTALIAAQMEFSIPRSDDRKHAGFAWRPYINWAENLVGDKDTIVTFNYDRVVEKAFALAGRELRPTQLLKMHGDLLQGQDAKGRLHALSVEDLHLQIRGFKPLTIKLGLPGESKSRIHGVGGMLEGVWTNARTKIREADTIVFVGYSLPPEDVEAMAMITDAIRGQDLAARHDLRIRLVLGPGTHEASLIEAILKQHAKHFDNAGLYTQHALTTWTRADVLPLGVNTDAVI